MGRETSSRRGDRLAEISGAIALAVGGGGSAFVAAPLVDLHGLGLTSSGTATVAAAAAGLAGGLIGWFLVRIVPGHPPATFAAFELAPVAPDFVDEEMDPFVAPAEAEEPLLLDDALVETDPDSRVVQLFAVSQAPTAGELQARIDRHLHHRPAASWDGPRAVPDATEALHNALDDLRRSLRSY